MSQPRPSPLIIAIDTFLAWPVALFVARLLLVSAYLIGGVQKLFDWPSAVAEQTHFGLAPPALWAGLTIVIELVGGIMVLFDWKGWLGAGMLGVFTILAAIVANDFWTMAGHDRFMATNAFFEHLGLAGAFVLSAMISRLHALD
ncbi:DoxX family protein [Qipengyuania sp. GH25]|uniref:DoxX family protein n=1 Tax=Qipengyuania pacifica TaxID=2860199 RepID=A0ABS7JHL4_9SPHN|nr:DoxX family protein [Qipengyuania aerophila]MBX7489523.1 DoxX family protein [Qipengyuania aerophila]